MIGHTGPFLQGRALDATRTFTADSDTIESDNYPQEYSNDADAGYFINTKCEKVVIKFNDVDLEADFDMLWVGW